MRKFWSEREPFVWATGIALTVTLLIAIILLVVIMVNGLGTFWPANVVELSLKDNTKAIGEEVKREKHSQKDYFRIQVKTGNRDLYGLDFRWIDESKISEKTFPEDIIVLERREHGNFYGRLKEVYSSDASLIQDKKLLEQFRAVLSYIEKQKSLLKKQEKKLTSLSNQLERIRVQILKEKFDQSSGFEAAIKELEGKEKGLKEDFEVALKEQNDSVLKLKGYEAKFEDANGKSKRVHLFDIVRFYHPNEMNWLEKSFFYLVKLKELLLDEPRESNTEGGLFPAIFGTIMMVFIMSIFSFPLGLVAAIYLAEYAKEGVVVRMVRIAVNNLAGIPSIVYGVFGLGFFVYAIGGSIDQLFYPHLLPTPTFGTGGILWASLTLAILTVPVVIVAAEEALSSVPKGMREASLALGATKFQTLVRVVLPMASPGIMTGFILSMARAAGEVAPLMLTGVVKLAPALPLDGEFPFLHLDRKFMHLGFHIYDVGFQSPNVEAAKPMVFVTTFVLVIIVLLMNSVAIYLRNQMKKRYTLKAF